MAKQYSAAPETVIEPGVAYRATLHTNHGDIEVSLLPDRSPSTVNNFVFLARDGFYDGVIFHRVIENFMIQGGDPTGTGRGGPGYRFADELNGAGVYSRGTVAMANAGPDTNGSQFFIMHRDYGLPHSYTIFGTVTAGLDAVDAIATTPTGAQDRPLTDCVIERVSISSAAAE
jgi:cyclophilin family peptidyl-prolyl cis-trans isomerase